MLYFTVDPRDGNGPGGSACNTCCCQSLSLRPGETNKMAINYAPWSVPIGFLSCGTEFSVETLDSCAQGGVIDGFGPPSNQDYSLDTPQNVQLALDVTTGAAPAGNTFTYRAIPFSGPTSGVLALNPDGTGTYTPYAGFVGWDSFWYETKDAQGRSIVRKVTIKVGNPITAQPPVGNGLQIPQDKVSVNERLHQIEFPISLPFSARDCETYRLTVRQAARDCDGNCFHHISCYDVRPGKC